MKINNWLKTSTRKLTESGSTSARLDALILLELVLHKERSYILAHLDNYLNTDQISQLSKLLMRRIHHEPLAYIRGFTEFYGRNFLVTPQVLIPRPESEAIITMLKSLQLPKHAAIADIGTGSGSLSITAALEISSATVDAYDISEGALHVARKNAEVLGARIHCVKQDLLTRPLTTYDVILANLPYITVDQPVSKDTKYEPPIALYSEDDGLQHINRLIEQLDNTRLHINGFLIIEAEPRQHNRIAAIGKNNGFSVIQKEGFCMMLQNTY